MVDLVLTSFQSLTAIGATEEAALQQQLEVLLEQKAQQRFDSKVLVRLADLYLDLGDDESQQTLQRLSWYEEGAKNAREALDYGETADAHYLYAANLGSAVQLRGLMASALTVAVLKRHVALALQLNPNHAPALHMMGMMLEELPWVFGGDHDGALKFLRQAVTADPSYAHARLDLAKLYLKRKEWEAARKELDILVALPLASDGSSADRRHREEAVRLRNFLQTS